MSRFLRTAAIFFLGCLAWTCAAEAGTGMSVSPSRFRLKKAAGQTASDKVTVTNSSSTPLQIETEVTDMVTRAGEDGLSVRDEAPAGTAPSSCAKWIQVVGAGTRIVQPGETAQLEFVVSPPREIRSGGYGAYIFLIGRPILPEKEKGEKETSVQLVTVPRLGVSVVYEVEGTIQREGNLLALEVTPPSGARPMKIRHQFKNTGNAEVILTGSFHVLDPQGLLVGKGSLKALKTFPGETAVTETEWQEPLSPGRYKVMVTLELGPDASQVIVREFPLDVTG